MNAQNNDGKKLVASIFIFVIIVFSILDIYNILKIIILIKKSYINFPQKIFEECYLYPKFFDIFIHFISFMIKLDIITLMIISVTNDFNLVNFTKKFGFIYGYFNYLIFGPFLLCGLIISFKYGVNVMKICVDNNPEQKLINFKSFFWFLTTLSLSTFIVFIGTYFFEENYFVNSIRLNNSGNYIVGILFWKTAYKIRNNNNEINGDNLEEGILDNNVDNNQNDIQNLIAI